MFSFLGKKSLVKRATFIGAVLVLLTGFFFVSCVEPDSDDIISGINAQTPTISVQPADTFWNVFTNEDGIELTVTANITDGGALSYQWYSNTTKSTVNGTKINTATNKDYSLTKTAYAENGAYYFYVIVTNTNNGASGTKVVSRTSNVATVAVVGYPDTGYSDTHTLPANLKGEWESEWGEIYTISDSEFSSGMDFGEGWSGYKGTIISHRGNAEGTAGYITIQYTQNDWDDDAEDKYYVIYYKDLSEAFVTIAGAGSFAFTDPDFGASGGRSTKDEAEATYTVSAGYFETGSDLTKTEEVGAFVLDAKFVGTWLASNGYGDGFIFTASPPHLVNDFMAGSGGGGVFYEGDIHDIVYFDNDKTEGIIIIELTFQDSYFATSGSGDFTAIYLKINSSTSMGIYLIALTEGGYDTPTYPDMATVKSTITKATISNYIYGSVTDGLSYNKE